MSTYNILWHIGSMVAAWTVYGITSYTNDAAWRVPVSVQALMLVLHFVRSIGAGRAVLAMIFLFRSVARNAWPDLTVACIEMPPHSTIAESLTLDMALVSASSVSLKWKAWSRELH
ncbi:hypothetical protein K431DRAFT_17545 [Polychaeton citri CBS 116435]|uniref:Uncharacterized protein n=1 Tax=Polychaeton citri CBS 116435 TaxID=1314669 RepID=A0A9P4UT45_9PEZI|nr:hypothetical protein K431DRAFT_17545 [Polychaeton citri CBS 116435]